MRAPIASASLACRQRAPRRIPGFDCWRRSIHASISGPIAGSPMLFKTCWDAAAAAAPGCGAIGESARPSGEHASTAHTISAHAARAHAVRVCAITTATREAAVHRLNVVAIVESFRAFGRPADTRLWERKVNRPCMKDEQALGKQILNPHQHDTIEVDPATAHKDSLL